MAVSRDKRGTWRYRKLVKLPDGSKVRINGTPTINTKLEAERAERDHVTRTLSPPPKKKEVPTFGTFAAQYLELAAMEIKPSTLRSKEMMLRVHLVPAFGNKRLDEVGYAQIQDYAARKAKKLERKTVNNHLSALRRILHVAKKRELIAAVPEIEWLDAPTPEFDFLNFEEAERVVDAAQEEWRCMILVAIRTGLRVGELLALRWEDVDLVAGRIRVCRSASKGTVTDEVTGKLVTMNGVVTEPKSGRSRDVPLGEEVKAALKAHRHLRGPLVFCDVVGRMMNRDRVKHPLWAACKAAKVRNVGWHDLRHTFASHLVMRGAPIKAVQELLGHATIEMTMRYAHLSPSVPRAAVRLLDGRGNSVAKTADPVEEPAVSALN